VNYLFFTNTPAHVHLYRHPVERLEDAGHEVLVLARDYTCTVDLLEYYDLPHEVVGYCGTSKYSVFAQLPAHYLRAARQARRFDPDLVFGTGCYAAHVAAVVRTPSVLVNDSEPADLDHAISKPFPRAILTPHTFRKDLGDRHYVFRGLKECAYLHPDVASPAEDVRDHLGLEPDERFVVLRLNAFGSGHDVGREGISEAQRRQLVRLLAEEATVLVSDEGGDMALEDLPARSFDLHPARMHDALAAADLLVADTQTMVTEAALLGTPAIRSNSFVGEDDMGNFLELEDVGLVRNVPTFEELRALSTELLRADGVQTAWQRRRDAYLADMVNLTDLLVDVARVQGRVAALDALHEYPHTVEPTASPTVDVEP